MLGFITGANLVKDNEDRRCVPTPYAKSKGVSESPLDSKGYCWWWLRSPGYFQNDAVNVLADGDINRSGAEVDFNNFAVRPALWMKTGSQKKKADAEIAVNAELEQQEASAADKTSFPVIRKDVYFKFGSYFQKNSSEKTPIEWQVLKKTDSKALLISRYCLGRRQYHHEWADITWENSDLRKWLNGEFLQSAFSKEEQKKIAVTEIANDGNSRYGTDGGNITEDRIFCLSIEEAKSLFENDKVRKCGFVPKWWKSEDSCWWWLRSPGFDQDCAALVLEDGVLSLNGSNVSQTGHALRPALWVHLDFLEECENAVMSSDSAARSAVSDDAVQDLYEDDYCTFGSYCRQNDGKKVPIEWLVLKRSGSMVLLISRYGLDYKQYHHECADITWEHCDLRKWLNGEFFRNAFSEEEQKKIVLTKLVNDSNPEYGTSGGNSTEDRVFCLSLEEAESLFDGDEARKCVPTSYAAEKGCDKSKFSLVDGRVCCSWWLRTPNRTQKDVLTTDEHGRLGSRTSYVWYIDSKSIAVRPVIWVNL